MEFEYGLVENALHSLSEAMNYYNEGDEGDNATQYKFSILLSAHCAELLLKEILRRNHPALLFEDIDKVSRMDDDSNQTVTYSTAIQRVKKLCEVNLHQYEGYLIELGKVRNQIQHFKYSINGEFHKRLMAQAFSAIEFLLRDILELRFEDFEEIIDKRDVDFLHEDALNLETRKKDIRQEIKDGVSTLFQVEYAPGKSLDVRCPCCGNEKVLVVADKITCKICGAEFDNYVAIHEQDQQCLTSSSILRELGRRKKLITIYECPECEYRSLVKGSNDEWHCLVCGNHFEGSTFCDECGNEMPNSESFYKIAMSDTDTNDYKYLCPDCAKEARESEDYIGYDIS